MCLGSSESWVLPETVAQGQRLQDGEHQATKDNNDKEVCESWAYIRTDGLGMLKDKCFLTLYLIPTKWKDCTICSESKPKIMLICMPEVKVVPFSPTSVPLYLCAALHLCPLLSYPTHKVKHQFVLPSSYLWQKEAKQDCTDKYTFRQLIKRTLWT